MKIDNIPSNVIIRNLSVDEKINLKQVMNVTGEKTGAKALLKAAFRYLDLLEKYNDLQGKMNILHKYNQDLEKGAGSIISGIENLKSLKRPDLNASSNDHPNFI
jgi:hypothetical protein